MNENYSFSISIFSVLLQANPITEIRTLYSEAMGEMEEVERFYFDQSGELVRFCRGDETVLSPLAELADLTEEVLKLGTNLAESFSLIH